MNRFVLIFSMIVILGSSINSILAQSVTFQYQPPKVGDVRTNTSKMNVNLQISAFMDKTELGKFQRYNSEDQIKKETVLAVQNNQISKMKVAYTQDEEVDTEDLTQKVAAARPTAGKTYILESKNGNLSITNVDGTKPSEKELEIIKKNYKNFGKPENISKELDGKTFSIGQRVPSLETFMKEAMLDPKSNIKKTEVKLKGQKECGSFTCGVFDVDMIITTQLEDGIAMEMKLSGDMLVATNTWPVKMLLKGPLTISGKTKKENQTISMSGSGTMNMSIEFVYSNSDQGLTFKYLAPKVGDTNTDTSKMMMNLKITAFVDQTEVGKFQRSSSEDLIKKETVLAVQNNQISKMKVAYTKDEAVDTDDETQKEPTIKPTAGKTYILESKNGNLSVIYADGSKPSDSEIEMIKKSYKDFGKPDDMSKELDGKTISIGQKAPSLENFIKTSMGGADGEVTKIEIKLKSQKECGSFTCGVFDIDMILVMKLEEGITMEVKLSGDMLVATNTLPIRMTLKGPITVSGKNQKEGHTISMTGSGNMDAVIEFVYSR